jgi:hypothetical protein
MLLFRINSESIILRNLNVLQISTYTGKHGHAATSWVGSVEPEVSNSSETHSARHTFIIPLSSSEKIHQGEIRFWGLTDL